MAKRIGSIESFMEDADVYEVVPVERLVTFYE